MAYSSEHVLLRLLGTFGANASSNAEQWSVSMRINTGSTGMTESAKVAFLETVSTPINAFHTNAGVFAGAWTWLNALSAAYIGTDGHYVGGGAQTTTVRPYTTPSAGTPASTISWDVARVFSLRTAQPRGRAHVGRFYYPCQDAIANDGRWGTTNCQNSANAAKTMIEQINLAAKQFWTASFGISVMSFVGAVSYPVNKVEVGRAPDTQRRRTKQLVEAPMSAVIAGQLTTEEAALGRVYS